MLSLNAWVRRWWISCLLLGLNAGAAKADPVVRPLGRFEEPRLGITVIAAEVELSSTAGWVYLKPAAGETAVDKISASRAEAQNAEYFKAHYAGRRLTLLERAREVAGRGSAAQNERVISALRLYAEKSGGRGPASWTEDAWLRAAGTNPYGEAAPVKLPFAANSEEASRVKAMSNILEGFSLLPRVKLNLPTTSYDAAAEPAMGGGEEKRPDKIEKTANRVPFLVETKPQIDDGMHWIVYNDLSSERVAVDAAWLGKQTLALDLSGVITLPDPEKTRAEKIVYTVTARLLDSQAKTLRLVAVVEGGREIPLVWPVESSPVGERILFTKWCEERARLWDELPGAVVHPFVPYWQEAHERVYGVPVSPRPWTERNNRRDNRETLSLLSLFGGKAAVEETLQLGETLALDETQEAAAKTTVAIEKVPGIEVAAHPFAAMLAGRTASALPIADLVPMDRAFVHVAKPAEFFAGAPDAVEFLRRVTAIASVSGSVSASQLVKRWGGELGLSAFEVVRLIAGDAQEFAVFLPDLNFGAGTEITLIVRFNTPLNGLTENPAAVDAGDGRRAWRAQRGAWSIFSTREQELKRALALFDARGAGSLGQSDEFRYMRTQLAPGQNTRAYVYLSDPFIRQLVGPARLVAQWRQSREIARMKQLAAAAALRRLDVNDAKLTVETLRELGYLAPQFVADGLELRDDGTVNSAVWGPLARLWPLDRNLPAKISGTEAEAYREFKDSYTDYWRRFFDPIAVRFDTPKGKPFELETFILPLIDSQAYSALHTMLPPGDETRELRGPVWVKPPVAALSFALNEDGWSHVADWLGSKTGRWMGFLPPRLVDEMGPSVHVALPDGAPVLQTGQGNFAEAFSMNGGLGGNSKELLALPVAINVLTRPVVVAIELQNPERAKRELAVCVTVPRFRDDSGGFLGGGPSLWMSKTGPDEHLLTVDFFGVLTQRYTLRIEGRWLLITNDPNAPRPLLASGETVRASSVASLRFEPGALDAGLVTAHRAAMDAEARAGWAKLAWLAPYLDQPLQVALEQNRRVLGYAPKLSADDLDPGGAPGWAGLKRFGSPWKPKLPPLDRENDFGLFEGVSAVEVSMQFEQDGLRSRVTWSAATGKP